MQSFQQWLESKHHLIAVIIKGNPRFIKNKRAQKFYKEIASYLKDKGCSVKFNAGKPYTTPPKADIWIGHSRGADRLRFAPKGTKTLAFGSKLPKAINHPKDDVETPYHLINKEPSKYHYIFTDKMKKAIDKLF